jgi:hypothetical protein
MSKQPILLLGARYHGQVSRTQVLNDPDENRTCNLPPCSSVPQPTASLHTPCYRPLENCILVTLCKNVNILC